MFKLESRQKNSIIYGVVFVFVSFILALFMLLNDIFNTPIDDELDVGEVDKKHQPIIAENKFPQPAPANEKNNEVIQPENSSQLANVEPISSTNEDNRQYIHSFDLWLEPDEIIKTLKDFLLDDDVDVRKQAVVELANIDSEKTLNVLGSILNDKDSHIRSEIIYALGESGNNSEHFLGQVLFSEEDPLLRIQAIRLLAKRLNPAAHSLMIVGMEDNNEQVREEAEYWLDSVVWDESLVEDEEYSSIFFSNNTEEKITTLQTVISQLSEEDAVSILQKVLLQEEDSSVRLQSVMELAIIDSHQAELALTVALGDDDVDVRYQAIKILADYGPSATHLLGQAIFSDPEPELRRRAYELLILQGNPAADALISEVENVGLEVLINSE